MTANITKKLVAANAELTAEEARKVTDSIKRNLTNLPTLIFRAMTGQAYKALGYGSVSEWSKEEFGLSKARIYQLMSWQTSLIALRERYALEEEWEMPEEKMRQLNSKRFAILLEKADEAVRGITDSAEKTKAVSDAVADSYRMFLQEKKLARLAKEAAARDASTDTPVAPVDDPSAVITPAEPSLALLMVKAKDTASILTSFTESAPEKDIALSKLREAQEVISELVRYYEAA